MSTWTPVHFNQLETLHECTKAATALKLLAMFVDKKDFPGGDIIRVARNNPSRMASATLLLEYQELAPLLQDLADKHIATLRKHGYDTAEFDGLLLLEQNGGLTR